MWCLLNSNLPFKLAVDSEGNYGYIKAGADSVTPFKNGDAFASYLPSSYSTEFALVSVGSGRGYQQFTNTITVQSSSNLDRRTLANIGGKGYTKISGGFDYAYHHVTFIKDDGTCEEATFGRSIDIPDGTVYVLYGFKNNQDNNQYAITFS